MSNRKSQGKIGIGAKNFKLVAVSFHGDLEVLGEEVANEFENNTFKKVFGVSLREVDRPSLVEEAKKVFYIESRVDECVKKYEGILKNQITTLEDDLIGYWSGTAKMVPRFNFQDRGDQEARKMKEIIPKRISPSDMQLFYEEILDGNLYTKDFVVVLFGKFSPMVISELLLCDLPLDSIIHFIPCPAADLQKICPELHSDIEFLRRSENAKKVGIFVETLPNANNFVWVEYVQDFCDQFVYYLYDLEMLRQQFIAYQTDFAEIDDAKEDLLPLPVGKCSLIKGASDDTMVGIYLDNLYLIIENRTADDRRYSYMHLRPFLDNKFDKIIVEESNKVLQAAIATRMNIMSYWRTIDILICSIKAFRSCPMDLSVNLKFPNYYELLSWETFAQRLNSERPLYDECCCMDLKDECQLYIFRRTFNKIVDVKRKFRLTTKLCFRDFCDYVVPDLADIIEAYNANMELELQDEDEKLNGNEKMKKVEPMFTGLSFSDTLQELSVNEKVFRFEDGSIRCSVENWHHQGRQLSMEIQLFDCSVFAHRWEGFASRHPRIRIMTQNEVTCNVYMQFASQYPNISIEWPNDGQIKYIHEDGAEAVEQHYHWKKRKEHKRLYTPQGCILNYLANDTIEVLTPNGVIYMLYPYNFTDEEIGDVLKYFHPLTETNVADEVAFVHSLHCYNIECEHFDVTRSNGKKLRVLNGIVMEQKAQYLVYEWTDYNANECYAERDDGVKLLWKEDALKCYYNCGTVITTTTVEDYIDLACECRSKSTEDILRKINPALVKRLVNKSKTLEQYVLYNVNYIMEHADYATVAFYSDEKVGIYSTEGFQVVISENNHVLIDIGAALSFRLTSGICTIASGVGIPEERKILLNLYLADDAHEILAFQNSNAFLALFADGEMTLTPKHGDIVPYTEEQYFLSDRYKFGMEFVSEDQYYDYIDRCPIYCYDTPTKTTLLRPIVTYDERFRMPIVDMENNLNKFKTPCQRTSKLDESTNRKKMERVLAARVIYKLDSASTDICRLVQDLYYIEAKLAKDVDDALSYFLEPKVMPKNTLKWREKIKQVRDNLEFNRQRRSVYNAMLRLNVFPKYHEYVENNGDLKKIDVNKLMLDKLNN